MCNDDVYWPLPPVAGQVICTTAWPPQVCRAWAESRTLLPNQSLQSTKHIDISVNILNNTLILTALTAHCTNMWRCVTSRAGQWHKLHDSVRVFWWGHWCLTFKMPLWLSSRLEVFRSRWRIQLSWRWRTPLNSWIISVLTSPGQKTKKPFRWTSSLCDDIIMNYSVWFRSYRAGRAVSWSPWDSSDHVQHNSSQCRFYPYYCPRRSPTRQAHAGEIQLHTKHTHSFSWTAINTPVY